jgi:hypothetical protein
MTRYVNRHSVLIPVQFNRGFLSGLRGDITVDEDQNWFICLLSQRLPYIDVM